MRNPHEGYLTLNEILSPSLEIRNSNFNPNTVDLDAHLCAP